MRGCERMSGLLPSLTGLGSSLRAYPGLPSWALRFRRFAAGGGIGQEHLRHEFGSACIVPRIFNREGR
jgi:hypothetical protein